jgi:hypothetical protein
VLSQLGKAHVKILLLLCQRGALASVTVCCQREAGDAKLDILVWRHLSQELAAALFNIVEAGVEVEGGGVMRRKQGLGSCYEEDAEELIGVMRGGRKLVGSRVDVAVDNIADYRRSLLDTRVQIRPCAVRQGGLLNREQSTREKAFSVDSVLLTQLILAVGVLRRHRAVGSVLSCCQEVQARQPTRMIALRIDILGDKSSRLVQNHLKLGLGAVARERNVAIVHH